MPGYDTIQENGSNLTQRTKLNFATALTASDDAANSRTNVNLEVTPASDGGAVAAQASLPGTAQARVFNLTAGRVGAGSVSAPSFQINTAKGLYQISTNDAAAASDDGTGTANTEYFRFGPDTRVNLPAVHFFVPVSIAKTLKYPTSSQGTPATGLEVLRVIPRVDAAATANNTWTGFGIANNPDGSDVRPDGFFHAVTVNVATQQASDANEMAAGAFFIYARKRGRVFGLDVQPIATPDMLAFPVYEIGLNVIPQNNVKSGTNTTSLWGALISNGSNGRPVGSGGTSQALRVDRQTLQDHSAGTVSVTNGSAVVTGSDTAWTTVGASPHVNLVDKRIKLPNGVYAIQSVDNATQITLTTSYTGTTASGQSYRIRVAEPWLFGAFLSACDSDAILVEQDANFPPSGVNTAFRVLNPAGTGNVYRFQYDGLVEQNLQSATTRGHLVRAAANQSAALAEFQDSSGSVQSQIDAKGSILTLESSRVAPWVEPQAAYTGAQFTVGTSRTDCASLTFTPASAVRLHVTASWDIEATTVSAGSVFVGELLVDGTPAAAQLVWESKTNGFRTSLSRSWTPTLSAGASHTIKTTARLNVGGATYRVNPTHTTLEISAIGRF